MNKYNRKNKEQEESNLTSRLLSGMGFLDMPIISTKATAMVC
jgi:hypothetical protein